MKEQKEIHIGSLIKEKMEERGLSVSDFAHALHYECTIIRYLSEAVLMWICYCVYRKS